MDSNCTERIEMNFKHTVIQYVRNKKGVPLGVVVSVKNDGGFSVGYSLCNKKDRFRKETALKIAFGRAESKGAILEVHEIPREIIKVIPMFVERCKRYYRTENAPEIRSF